MAFLSHRNFRYQINRGKKTSIAVSLKEVFLNIELLNQQRISTVKIHLKEFPILKSTGNQTPNLNFLYKALLTIENPYYSRQF